MNQTIIDTSMIGIITYLANTGECVTANDAAATIIGTTMGQLQRTDFLQLESWKKSGLLPFCARQADGRDTRRISGGKAKNGNTLDQTLR
jgi:hypothetical protein